MNPQYPIYIVSKGRWKSRLTSKILEKLGIPYHIVIEPQEYKQYAKYISEEKILKLPFSNLGQGSIPARNWIWEHSLKQKAKRHWILDDNISEFRYVVKGKRIRVGDGTIFRAAEDFVDRYKNVALAGFQYTCFPSTAKNLKPFIINTRIYSNILILNELPYRWRGKYNEDTDLSLRALKDGWCTILFYIFMADKQATMRMKGGNTEELYKLKKKDGRLEMAKSLQKQHPDVVKIMRKWGRWQHQVNYEPFRKNKLIKKKNININKDYGLRVVKT